MQSNPLDYLRHLTADFEGILQQKNERMWKFMRNLKSTILLAGLILAYGLPADALTLVKAGKAQSDIVLELPDDSLPLSYAAQELKEHFELACGAAPEIIKESQYKSGPAIMIGETAVVEEGVVIYQGATLGGTGKEKGKRHPTVKRGAIISAGARVLGGFTVGEYAKIGANAVVLREVPPYATVVGVPAHVVRINGEKTEDLEQEKTDPLQEEICNLQGKIYELQRQIEELKSGGKGKKDD